MRKTIMAIVAAIVVGFTMSAKAATEPSLSVKVDGLKSNVAVTGDTVTAIVSVNGVEKNIISANFKLTYDKKQLKYVGVSTAELIANDDLYADGTLFSYASATGTKSFAIKFEVIGKSGDVSVGVEPNLLGVVGDDNEETELTVNPKVEPAKVTVSETAPSTKPSTGNNNNTNTNTNNSNTTTDKPAANTTTKKKPTKYDQTGRNVLNYVGVVGLVTAAAAGTVALKKCKNN